MNEEAVFTRAVEIPTAAERSAFLNEACGDDGDLRARVEQLLKAHGQPVSMLDQPAYPELLTADALPGIPDRLGDFEILREIGCGGMGVVYEARQVSLKRHVALKVLSGGLALSPKAIARFRREAEAAARLHHTNIVPIYYTGEEDRLPYYVMELVEGPSLDRIICVMRDGKSEPIAQPAADSKASNKVAAADATTSVSPRPNDTVISQADPPTPDLSSSFGSGSTYFDNVARAMAEVADALAHAHEQGVIHRDVKPSNLLLSPDGRLSINDFGLARLMEQPGMTVTGEFAGSPLYMSPEQIACDQRTVDHRTDIYSLGATLYELLTLRPPFYGEHRDQILAQVLHREPPAPRRINNKIPKDLETICCKAMDKDPARRYQSCLELADDLRRFFDRHAISARRISPAARAARWCRRNPAVSALSAALIVLSVVVAAAAGWQMHQQRRLQNFVDVIVPELRNMIEEGRESEALERIIQLQEQFAGRPALEDLLQQIRPRVSFFSEPPGAVVASRPASDPSGRWTVIGKTPFTDWAPTEDTHFKVAKAGYVDLFTYHTGRAFDPRWRDDFAHDSSELQFHLSKSTDAVYVPQTPGRNLYFLSTKYIPTIASFLIDRFETTNAEFQQFVDQGGYSQEQYWSDLIADVGSSWRSVVDDQFLTRSTDESMRRHGPSTWKNGVFRPGTENHPVRGVSWYEAAAYAKFAGKQLPTVFHWYAAAGRPPFEAPPHSNIDNEHSEPRDVGAQLSVGGFGAYDMSGNVSEWCANDTGDDTKYVLGGSWRDDSVLFTNPLYLSPLSRIDDVGFRCVKYLGEPDLAFKDDLPIGWRDYSTLIAEEAWSDTPDNVIQRFFNYARDAHLNATEAPETVNGMARIRVSFDPAYEPRENSVVGYLVLPDRAEFAPPYQTVVLFPSGAAVNADGGKHWHLQFYLDSGRAILHPIYWGTYHRSDTESISNYQRATPEYAAGVVRMARDFFRSLDYLRVRDQQFGEDLIAEDKLAFHGNSWGGCMGPLLISADQIVSGTQRIEAAVLCNAGFCKFETQPLADIFTFAPRLHSPTLMISAQNDRWMPLLQSKQPMYDLFPLEHGVAKRHYVADSERWLSEQTVAEQSNQWLDKWLGAPKRLNQAAP